MPAAEMELGLIPAGARGILAAIRQQGGEAYMVGGCVRDLLSGAVPHDWDICTSLPPEEVLRLFAPRSLPTGLRHGTVTVQAEDGDYEVTTWRVDGPYLDSRHPEAVRFTPSLTEDLARRDFTINAMALTEEGELLDPFGGREDLARGLIRCVGDPLRRFSEDALRILRALRFAAQLGFVIDGPTREALYEKRDGLRRLSSERVREELVKTLCGPDAKAVLDEHAELFADIIPELRPMFGFSQHSPWHIYDVWRHTLTVLENVPPQPTLRLAALLHDMAKPHTFRPDANGVGHFPGHAAESARMAEPVLRRLRFDHETVRTVTELIAWHDNHAHERAGSVRRFLSRLGEEQFRRLLLLQRGDDLGKAPRVWENIARYDRLLALTDRVMAEHPCLSVQGLAIGGEDLAALGIPPGRRMGEILQRLLDEVLRDPAKNTRERLCALALSLPEAEEEEPGEIYE